MHILRHQTHYILYSTSNSQCTFSPDTDTRHSLAANLYAVLLRFILRACSHRADCETSEILVHIGWKIPPQRNMAFSMNLSAIMSCFICIFHLQLYSKRSCWNQYGVKFVTCTSRLIRRKSPVGETLVIWGIECC